MSEDDFEDAREHGIDPDVARRANAMFLKWHDAITEAFPLALDGDADQITTVIKGAASLLGELAGIIWCESDEATAREVLRSAASMTNKKMTMFFLEVRGPHPH